MLVYKKKKRRKCELAAFIIRIDKHSTRRLHGLYRQNNGRLGHVLTHESDSRTRLKWCPWHTWQKWAPKVAPQVCLQFLSPVFRQKCQKAAPCIAEFESEAPAAEEMLDRVVYNRKRFSFRMCIERDDGSGTFRNWRQRVLDSWCYDAEFLGLKIDPRGIILAPKINMTESDEDDTFSVAAAVIILGNEKSKH